MSTYRAPLLEFIKQTSLGHNFSFEYEVKNHQIHRAFQAFLADDTSTHTIDRSDALRQDVNEWDDYVWIDVGNFSDEHDNLKTRKDRAIDALLAAFEGWAAAPSTFEEDVQIELRADANSYIDHYVNYVTRIVSGEPKAHLSSNENSMRVESLLHYDKVLPLPLRMQRIQAFFHSDYFFNVPEARIGSELFVLLRHRLRQGEYKNMQKNRDRFGGFFYDIRFISTYAPYCDAMLVGDMMFQYATDPLIDLPKRFGVRLFSRRNWDDFLTYLADLSASQRPEG